MLGRLPPRRDLTEVPEPWKTPGTGATELGPQQTQYSMAAVR